MTPEFWLPAALLLLAALALVLVPLLRRHGDESDGDEHLQLHARLHERRCAELRAERDSGNLDAAQYTAALRELERELLHDTQGRTPIRHPGRGTPLAVVVVILLVPLVTVLLYQRQGALGPLLASQATADAVDTALPAVEDMLDRLSARLADNPDDLDGWLLLGRSQITLRQFRAAEAAYARAHALQPDDPTVLTAYAEAMALARDSDLRGRPAELVEQALQLEPDHADALWLGAMAAIQAGHHPLALARLQRLLDQLEPGGPDARMVQNHMEQLQARLEPAHDAAPTTAPPATRAAAIEVTARLAPALRDDVDPGDTLFIYARAPPGPPSPLAIARLRAADLPATVTLDDSSAMMAGRALSNVDSVVIMARITPSGDAITRSGDLLGATDPVAVRDSGSVEVVIDTRVP